MIQSALHEALGVLIASGDFASATVIENPLQPLDASVLERHGLRQVDDRIGQISSLPRDGDIESQLFARFHSKTRNMVRKGQSQGQTIASVSDPDSLAWLQATHENSIRSLGGVPKPLAIFQHLLGEFPAPGHSRLYIGSIGARRVAGLLVLLYGTTVEYFTPVVDDAERDKQVLSHVIFHAMAELAREGFERWNWGGTWRSQAGVLHFKGRWGATEHVYRYFNRCTDPRIRALSREVLAAAFPYFYLYNYQDSIRP